MTGLPPIDKVPVVLITSVARGRIIKELTSKSKYGPLSDDDIDELMLDLGNCLRTYQQVKAFEAQKIRRTIEKERAEAFIDAIRAVKRSYASLGPYFRTSIDFTVVLRGTGEPMRIDEILKLLSDVERGAYDSFERFDTPKGKDRNIAVLITVERLSVFFRRFSGRMPKAPFPNPKTGRLDNPFLRFCTECFSVVGGIDNSMLANAIRDAAKGKGPVSSILNIKSFPPY